MQGVNHRLSKVETVTPQTAAHYLTFNDPDRQRPQSESHVLKLGMMMTGGDFLTGHVVLAAMGGKRLLANGQHTLRAIIETGLAQRCLVEEYTVQDLAAYSRLFHAFDTEARQRTWTECARAYRMGREGAIPEGTTEQILNQFRNGYEYHIAMTRSADRSATKFGRFDDLSGMARELRLVTELFQSTIDGKLIRRAPIIAAIIGTCQADYDASGMFWREVVTGFFADHGNPEAPTYRLHQYLRSVTILTGGGGHYRSKNRIGNSAYHGTQFDVYCSCINAWNAFCEGRDLKLLKASVGGKIPPIHRPSPARTVS